MTQQDSSKVMKFELMVGDTYQPFEIDMSEQTFTGTETLLIDQYAGDLMGWINRWAAEQPRGSDVVLLAFLATRRAQIAEQGVASVVWDEFAEQVRPFSLRLPSDDVVAAKANRSDRRAVSRSGSAAKRSTT